MWKTLRIFKLVLKQLYGNGIDDCVLILYFNSLTFTFIFSVKGKDVLLSKVSNTKKLNTNSVRSATSGSAAFSFL